mgnify:CR=1 FL=1
MCVFFVYAGVMCTTLPRGRGEKMIPFAVISQTLVVIIIPLTIGLLMQYKLPRVAKVLRKCLKVILMSRRQTYNNKHQLTV